MVLMDQPFAALVKELFDVQKYPELPHPPAGRSGCRRRRRWRRRWRRSRRGGGCRSGSCRRRQPPRRRQRGGGGRGAAVDAAPRGGGAARQPHSAARAIPYDVTGWTLPMQMGVEVVAVVAAGHRRARARTLRKLESVEPIAGKVEGAGPVFAFSHNTNAALRAVNEILAAGGTVSFAKTGRHDLRQGQCRRDPAEERRRCHVAERSARTRGR